MKQFIIMLALCLASLIGQSQALKVAGKLKVSDMYISNTENLLVVKHADGTLATKQLSSLPPPLSSDTMRTLQTDRVLAKLICDCGNNLSSFIVEHILTSGYSATHLIDAGVSITVLFNSGVSPIDLFNGEVSLDSLYGQTYKGSQIFYLDTSGNHPIDGLLSAPSDQDAAAEWGCLGTDFQGAKGTVVGAGNQNTIDIENSCSTVGIAADVCPNLSQNGYDDWFLPTKDELNAMYIYLHLLGPAGFGSEQGVGYWSLSESISTQGWRLTFFNGNVFPINEDVTYRVKAARAFSTILKLTIS